MYLSSVRPKLGFGMDMGTEPRSNFGIGIRADFFFRKSKILQYLLANFV